MARTFKMAPPVRISSVQATRQAPRNFHTTAVRSKDPYVLSIDLYKDHTQSHFVLKACVAFSGATAVSLIRAWDAGDEGPQNGRRWQHPRSITSSVAPYFFLAARYNWSAVLERSKGEKKKKKTLMDSGRYIATSGRTKRRAFPVGGALIDLTTSSRRGTSFRADLYEQQQQRSFIKSRQTCSRHGVRNARVACRQRWRKRVSGPPGLFSPPLDGSWPVSAHAVMHTYGRPLFLDGPAFGSSINSVPTSAVFLRKLAGDKPEL
ncbi:hypothetical protein HPB50_009540 [Hyalomma asiaticum]|uniref:Uncharacterized protein n=1 Tax=Hyalomma asiaticum TaxID=266040 RepID=A0ACB7SWU9_HYAAI|nr:hypothetical protein HPB50_009540 [Hyalomma asiaticum]